MSAAFDIATLIQTGGHAVLNTNMGVNAFLDKTDNEVAVFEFAGLPDLKTHGGTVAFEYPKIQVQVRHASAAAAWTLAYNIYKYLRGKMDQTLNGHTYQYIESLVFPHVLSRDEQNRTIYLIEFQVHRSPEA